MYNAALLSRFVTARELGRLVLVGDRRPGRPISPWPHFWRCSLGVWLAISGAIILGLAITNAQQTERRTTEAELLWQQLFGLSLGFAVLSFYLAVMVSSLQELPPREAGEVE